MATITIITSFALPSYRMLIEKRQVTSGAEQLAGFISTAQIEAVKRSENISVTYNRTDADTWCIGLVTGTTACDCTDNDPATADCKVDSQVRIINDANLVYPGIMDDMDGDGSFVYDPARGLMVDHTDAMELVLLSDNSTYALKVQLTATGRVKMCSGSSDKQVPGYDVCTTDIQ